MNFIRTQLGRPIGLSLFALLALIFAACSPSLAGQDNSEDSAGSQQTFAASQSRQNPAINDSAVAKAVVPQDSPANETKSKSSVTVESESESASEGQDSHPAPTEVETESAVEASTSNPVAASSPPTHTPDSEADANSEADEQTSAPETVVEVQASATAETVINEETTPVEADPSPTAVPKTTPAPEPADEKFSLTAIPQPVAKSFGNDVDDAAFRFVLSSASGDDASLESYLGEKNVVLVFYRAFW